MSINQSAVIEDEILSRMKQKEFNEEQIIMGAELTDLQINFIPTAARATVQKHQWTQLYFAAGKSNKPHKSQLVQGKQDPDYLW